MARADELRAEFFAWVDTLIDGCPSRYWVEADCPIWDIEVRDRDPVSGEKFEYGIRYFYDLLRKWMDDARDAEDVETTMPVRFRSALEAAIKLRIGDEERWAENKDDFLAALHHGGPSFFIRATNDQRGVEAFSPDGFEQLYVHKPRGLYAQPGFTCLNADFHGRRFNVEYPPIDIPPSAVFRLKDRHSAVWILKEPVWPGPDFYRRQQMLNVWLGTPEDRAGLSRLLPLPGGKEFRCQMTHWDPEAVYRLSDFKL